MGSGVKLFDAHCHLQDPRIHSIAPHLIRNAFHSGVLRFAINGVSENDWRVVKEMAEQHPCLVPNFGLHPWYVAERTPNWFFSLREFFASTPSAAVGEIGLDKGSHGKTIDFGEQVEVFQQQLELAKELKRPASVHCVRAFGDLLEILKRLGPFPEGLIMHSYLGSAEMVPELAKLGCYFSFSGFLSSMGLQKAKKMIRSVPLDRILLESDAPDALPKFKSNFVSLVQENSSALQKLLGQSENQSSESSDRLNQELNHPANIHSVLNYASSLLEMPENELAEVSYRNAIRLFSFPGSKVCAEGRYAEGKRSRGVEDYDDISQSPMHTPSPSVFTPNDSRQASPIHEMEDDDIMQVEPPCSQPRNPQTQSSSNDILRGIRDQDGQRRKRERTGKKPQDSIFNMDKYIAFRERENKEYMDVLKGTQVVEKHTIEDCMNVFNEMSAIFTDEEMFKATQIFIKDKSYRELFLCLQEDHRVPWLRMMFNKIE